MLVEKLLFRKAVNHPCAGQRGTPDRVCERPPANGSPAFSATVFARRTATQADSLREGAEVDVVYDGTNPYAVMRGPETWRLVAGSSSPSGSPTVCSAAPTGRTGESSAERR